MKSLRVTLFPLAAIASRPLLANLLAGQLLSQAFLAGTLRAVAGNVLIMEQDRILREALTV